MVSAQLSRDERDTLADSIGRLRRAMLRDGLLGAVAALGHADLSLTQLAALVLLDDQGEHTIKALAERLGRSVSATSRLVDQLVRRGLVHRREDEQDRRIRWVALADRGRTFIGELDRRRAEAQLAVMAGLSVEEQVDVMRAMRLLGQAASTSRRRSDERPGPGSAAG